MITNEEIVQSIQEGIEVKENMNVLYQQNRGIIWKIAKTYGSYAEMDDLMQEGYMGLYEAVLRYNPAAGCKFMSYAGTWIKKMILLYIAQNGILVKMPRNIYWQCQKYKKFIQKYKGEYNRNPTEEEVIKGITITPQDLQLVIHACNLLLMQSTSQTLQKDNTDITILDNIVGISDVENEVIENVSDARIKEVLWQQVQQLEEIQIKIIELKYQRKMKIKDIANQIGIKESTVREKERRALMTLNHNRHIRAAVDIQETSDMNLYRGIGLTTYRNTGTSLTEFEALKRYDSIKR